MVPMPRAVRICCVCFCLCLCIAPAVAANEAVVRTILPAAADDGLVYEVTLECPGISVGGIVETIPEDFVLVGTTHPAGQVLVSGRDVAFAVIDESRIVYTAKSGPDASGTFTGVWEDILSGSGGSIAPTGVAGGTIVPVEAQDPSGQTTAEAEPPRAPGFPAAAAVFALGCGCLASMKRGGA